MIVRTAGEPRLYLGRLVGGIVVQDDMDFEPFGHVSVDLLEEVQELGRPMSLVAFADDEAHEVRVCISRERLVLAERRFWNICSRAWGVSGHRSSQPIYAGQDGRSIAVRRSGL